MQPSPALAAALAAEPSDGVLDRPAGLWSQFLGFWGDHWDVILWKVVAIVAIIAVALLVRWLLHFAIVRIVDRIVTGVKRKQDVTDTQALAASPVAVVRVVQRTRTLGTVLKNIVNVTLFIIVVLSIVNTIDSGLLGSFALLSAAIGAGLGFGAQNIVKDVLNGLFMVIEDQIGVGDIVDLGFATGVVEEVRVRVTTVRDVNGTIWFVRNGEILRVGNISQGWSRAVIDVSVPKDADLDAVEAALLSTAIELSQASRWRSRFVDRPEVWGLEQVSADAAVLRVVAKTRAAAKEDVAQELRRRLKRTVEELGIELPQLHSVVLSGFESVTRVRGAQPPRTKPNPVLGDPGSPQAKTKPKRGRTAAGAGPAGTGAEPRTPRSPRPKTPGIPVVPPETKHDD